ncbi:MRP family ATP-binding protein [Rhodohalobacter sp. SW132]|uniref:Mrp/NBP35 family ATP-binding protein n=1 Tax=Rhodohalobacter sp. SW132 TaxID=2293433 RepID=UPI000E251ADD|nr:Mrp/NBP35 family ATP-binding protein [Rhodohalobacter sp. SW132]REL38746.1 MRP family ATP-binding protein [Rhodohalobacter sp. SW132]
MAIRKEQVITALTHVLHPEYEKDLITLDLIQDLIVQEKYISFTLELPSENKPLAADLKKQCTEAVHKFVDKEAVLDITVGINISKKRELDGDDAAPQPQQQNAGQQQPVLPGVKNIIAVASGKGGVGKSTVAANLAVALSKAGHSVGLLDTDIYGPSVPTMFGVTERPNITTDKKLVPIYKHGVHLVSMGFLVDTDQAMIWRGPMVTSAVKQFMQEVKWGELDYLVLDLPPGTGDIQLTIVQTVPLTAAVIVSTPQTVALDDARKGVAMFGKVDVPVLGIIENMAYFTPPDMPEKKYYIFGKHGARKLAQKLEVPFLGEVALQENIRETSDSGTPVVEAQPDSPAAKSFLQIGERVKNALITLNKDPEKIEINIRP